MFRDYEVIQDVSPELYVAAGTRRIFIDVIKKHALGILDDLQDKDGKQTGLDDLLKLDHYSARAYMTTLYRPSKDLNLPNLPLTTDVVNWIEAFESSTGSFDRAFSEMILEAVAFGFDGNDFPPTNWYYVRYVQSKHLHACDIATYHPTAVAPLSLQIPCTSI